MPTVITTTKYVHVTLQKAAARPRHPRRDVPGGCDLFPLEQEKKVVELLKYSNGMTNQKEVSSDQSERR